MKISFIMLPSCSRNWKTAVKFLFPCRHPRGMSIKVPKSDAIAVNESRMGERITPLQSYAPVISKVTTSTVAAA
eukprot:m.142134 g.142134  ORF g.142134 m.142134 type:complete len:74 (+) comp38357_c0_seq1:297-518(+)